MRTLRVIALAGTLAAAASGCGNEAAGTPSTTTPPSKVTTTGASTSPVSPTDTTGTTTIPMESGEIACGTFTAAGETAARTTWRIYSRNAPCRVARPVLTEFNRTGKAPDGWHCTGEDVLTRCTRLAASVRAVASE